MYIWHLITIIPDNEFGYDDRKPLLVKQMICIEFVIILLFCQTSYLTQLTNRNLVQRRLDYGSNNSKTSFLKLFGFFLSSYLRFRKHLNLFIRSTKSFSFRSVQARTWIWAALLRLGLSTQIGININKRWINRFSFKIYQYNFLEIVTDVSTTITFPLLELVMWLFELVLELQEFCICECGEIFLTLFWYFHYLEEVFLSLQF
jgi:hypothetical protein